MKGSKRKTRPDKFPLTRHPTGQYCKKIRGRMYYSGSDRQQSLERYLDQATYSHGGQNLIYHSSNGNMSLIELCDLYLKYQNLKVLAGELTPKHHNDQINSVRKLISFLAEVEK